MFPAVGRGRTQQTSAETAQGTGDTRQLAVVSLELKTTRVNAEPAADAAGHHNRKQQRNRRSSLRHDVSDNRLGAAKNVSRESRWSAATDDAIIQSAVSLPTDTLRQALRFHPAVANPAAASTNGKQTGAARLPPLLNTNVSVSHVNEASTTQAIRTRRRSDGAACGPFEVCALRWNPDVKSLQTAAKAGPCHQQQPSATDAAGNKSTTNSLPAAASNSPSQDGTSTGDAAEFDLRLPLSDNEDEEDDTADCCYSGCYSADKMSIGSSSTPGITVDSCAILSVRIEFCKSQRTPEDGDNAATSSATTQCDCSNGGSDGDANGRRRPMAGRTHPHKTRNNAKAKTPTSPSKAISVVGRGRVVVLEDGVYDQFARRQPPKYHSNRMFDAYVLNKRAFSK